MLQIGVFLNDRLRIVGIKSGWHSLHFTNETAEAEEHIRFCGQWWFESIYLPLSSKHSSNQPLTRVAVVDLPNP